MLKTPEGYQPENTLICRQFTIFRTLLKSITRPLQGGGRWFEPSIAHYKAPAKDGILRARREGQEEFPGPLTATVLQPERSPAHDMVPNAVSIELAAKFCSRAGRENR